MGFTISKKTISKKIGKRRRGATSRTIGSKPAELTIFFSGSLAVFAGRNRMPRP